MDVYAEVLLESVRKALARTSTDMPVLTGRAATRLRWGQSPDLPRDRLFAVVVAGAMCGRPAQALPVSTLSTLWWTGIGSELSDSTILALGHIGRIRAPKERKLAWVEDLTSSTASVAETRHVASARRFALPRREDVLSDHLGVDGAAYARDAVMAARICAPRSIEAWRRFGALYGLLRRLNQDQQQSTVEQSANPQLRVPGLLMAHAGALATSGVRAVLGDLLRAAPQDVRTRATARAVLRSPEVVTAYRTDLLALHRRACKRLDELAPEPVYGELLRSALDEVLDESSPKPRELVAL